MNHSTVDWEICKDNAGFSSRRKSDQWTLVFVGLLWEEGINIWLFGLSAIKVGQVFIFISDKIDTKLKVNFKIELKKSFLIKLNLITISETLIISEWYCFHSNDNKFPYSTLSNTHVFN